MLRRPLKYFCSLGIHILTNKFVVLNKSSTLQKLVINFVTTLSPAVLRGVTGFRIWVINNERPVFASFRGFVSWWFRSIIFVSSLSLLVFFPTLWAGSFSFLSNVRVASSSLFITAAFIFKSISAAVGTAAATVSSSSSASASALASSVTSSSAEVYFVEGKNIELEFH